MVIKTPLAWVLSSLLAVSSLSGDEIHLRSGEVAQGSIKGESVRIATDQGLVEVPFGSIKTLEKAEDGMSQLLLVDGTVLRGAPVDDKVTLSQGLFDRVYSLDEVRSIHWSPPSIALPEGTSVELQLVRSLGSAQSRPGDPATYCVSKAVRVEGQDAIAEHAPAAGQVLGTGGGRNVEGGEKIGLSATRVLASDGTWIPLSGRLEAQGGFDPGRGLLVGGSPAVASAGTLLEARTAAAATIQPTTSPSIPADAEELVNLCHEYFKFEGRDSIPLEEMARNQAYAPMPQPLRVSMSLSHLFVGLTPRQGRSESYPQFRYVDCDAVSISNVALTLDLRRHGDAMLTIASSITVRPSFDRWVALKYEISVDGAPLKSLSVNRIDAEERKTKISTAKLPLSKGEFERLRASKDPRISIAMTAIAN